MRYIIETECQHGQFERCTVIKYCVDLSRHVGQDYDHSECQTWWRCRGGSRRVVTPTPMIRMGGLTPAWYVQDEDDTDEPDGWLIQ